MTMLRFAAVGLALLVAGCVTCYHKDGAQVGDFDRDQKDCEANRPAGASKNPFQKRDEYMEACMTEKGWSIKHR